MRKKTKYVVMFAKLNKNGPLDIASAMYKHATSEVFTRVIPKPTQYGQPPCYIKMFPAKGYIHEGVVLI